MKIKAIVTKNWCLIGFILLIFLSSLNGCYYTAGTTFRGSYTKISVSEAKDLVDNNEKLFILDVRTDAEYNVGHISGAYLIPHFDIMTRQDELPKKKSRSILVYCKLGGRSADASATLNSLGYTQVNNMDGGFDAWKEADYPYETGPFIKPTTPSNITQLSSDTSTFSKNSTSTPIFELAFGIISLLFIVFKRKLKR